MSDEELLAYMREDGMGDVNKAHHPSVYDEYDYRHGDKQLESYDAALVRLSESGTTLEQAEEMLANLGKDVSRFATEERAELLGQEEALQEYIAGLEQVRYDRQGNPVDADGNLILEEIASVDELTGEDFSRPSRNVQLPKIPNNVDSAIGAGGKPVIIKKNIFEKNARDHKDLKPSQSRAILKTALYTPNLYGQNQKASRPYNYVVISTKGTDGKNKLVLLEVNNGKENVEIVHWHYIRDNALETLKRQAEREGGHILILPSENSKEAGGLSSRTHDLSSAGKGTDLFGNAQEKGKKSSSKKIDDFGEKIGGARKDIARSRIRDVKNMTEKDLASLKKGADDILSPANIIRLHKEGQMDEQTARQFLAFNNVVKVAKRKFLGTTANMALNKYRDAAVAWEEGRQVAFEVTDEDVREYMKAFPRADEGRARESLNYTIIEPYTMFMRMYEAIDYPAVQRKLGQHIIKDYTLRKGKQVTSEYPYWVMNGYGALRGFPFKTLEGAVNKLKELCPEIKESEKKEKGEKAEHGLRVVKEDYGFYVKSRNIPGNIYLSPRFWTESEAKEYLNKNIERLKEREQSLVIALMGSNIGMAEREGVDYRNGKDVKPQDFLDEFGFRGVEFGNWVPQGERQMYLNKTYDAIKDFFAIVGISPRAFSLGGRLGLAFGARGHSRANAHYEPMKEAINLTRMSGVGSLAHEWFHAVDNYLAKQKTGNISDMATVTHDVVRQELADVFKELYNVMKSMDYAIRSRRAGDYWGRTEEEFARLFENYIYNKLTEKEMISPILVRKDVLLDDVEENVRSRWPYPSREENERMQPYFDKLFDTIQEKTDENGNAVLFQRVDDSVMRRESDAIEEAMRDEVVRLMREAGIEVSTDWEAGQRVLDMVNGEAKLMGSRTNRKMAEVGAALEGRELSEQQQSVVDVFSGKTDNMPVEVEREDGNVRVVMRQGNDGKAGTKHSLYGHYGTNKGVITAEDILIVPDVLANGERTDKQRGNTPLVEYKYTDENGTTYTVLTEKKHGREEFADFYTNKKTPQSARKTRSVEARDIDNSDVSGAKLQQNSDTAKDSDEIIREHRVYHGSGVDFDAFDHSHMGEGEGAQSYGYGSYVTEVEGIGRTYARSMVRKPIGSRPVLYKGKDVKNINQDGWSDAKKDVFNGIVERARSMGKSARVAKWDLLTTIDVTIKQSEKGIERAKLHEEKWKKAVKYLEGLTDAQFKELVSSEKWKDFDGDLRYLKFAISDNYDLGRGGVLLVCEEGIENSKDSQKFYGNRKSSAEKQLEALKEFDENDFSRVDYEPILYTVDIPNNDGSNYLDYVANMEQQADLLGKINKGLERLGWKRSGMTWSNDTHRVGYELAPYKKGRNIYEALSHMFGSDKAASEFLRSIGIVGIKYPAEFRSGGRGDNASNYVIFNESDLKITDKVKFFRTSGGEAYGFALGGKIYLDPRIATAETPMHEYAHLWAQALRKANPKAWDKLKEEMMKEQDVVDYVKRLYPDITDENDLMEEVFTHYGGKRGAERLRHQMQEEMAKANGTTEKTRIKALFDKLRSMLNKFWYMARDLFAGENGNLSSMKGEDFANMMMNDLINGFNPQEKESVRDKEYLDDVAAGVGESEESYGSDARRIAIDDRVAQREYLFNNEPVSKLTGKEFARQEGKTLTEQVGEYFLSIGGKAVSRTLGEVVLDERGAEDSLAHGMGRNKAIAYAAVKDVIEKGVVVQEHVNHKGRGYNTAMIVAPITIGDERYACCVVVRQNVKENRYYLHEVTAQKNLQDDAFITNLAQKPASSGDVAEVLKEIVTTKGNGEKIAEDTTMFRIREDEPPTKKGVGYKVFVLKDGKLYPPMVANPNGEDTVTSKKEKLKGKTLPPSKTPGQSDVEAGAVSSNLSNGKDTDLFGNVQGKKNIPSFDKIDDVGERLMKAQNHNWRNKTTSNSLYGLGRLECYS